MSSSSTLIQLSKHWVQSFAEHGGKKNKCFDLTSSSLEGWPRLRLSEEGIPRIARIGASSNP